MHQRYLRTLIFFSWLFVCDIQSYAQSSSPSEVLGLFSSGYAGAGAAPKVNLNTYKFTALLGKSSMEFYLHNSVPTVVPTLLEDSNIQTPEERKKNPSRRYLSNDILQPIGGLLNLSLGKKIFFNRDSILKDVKGGQLDFYIGGKLLESPFERGSEFFPSAQAYFDYKYLIPLLNDINPISTDTLSKKKKYSRDALVGNLSFKISGSIQKFFTNQIASDPYSAFFKTYELDDETGLTNVLLPRSVAFSGNIECFFHITNQIAISGGYFYCSDPLIHSYPYFAISYGD
jgi:hypothetical protein